MGESTSRTRIAEHEGTASYNAIDAKTLAFPDSFVRDATCAKGKPQAYLPTIEGIDDKGTQAF